MRCFEKTLSHRRPWSRALMELLGARLRRALSVPDATAADLQAAEAMIAAARCAFGPFDVWREGSKLRYSAAPDALGMHRQPLAELPGSACAARPLRDCYPH